jgi:hypothetical protein
MKKQILLLLFLSSAIGQAAFAAKLPTVESRNAFVKITDADKPVGAPVDRDAPEVLYIRKSAIVRVSVVFATRSTEFRVIVVTSSPVTTTRFDEDKLTVTNDAKAYFYSFPNEASATAFCEAIVAEQKG